tara:strand:- start:2173 stop:2292 length:120 start_codon:yes stop_codon:yes gene_type:complete
MLKLILDLYEKSITKTEVIKDISMEYVDKKNTRKIRHNL